MPLIASVTVASFAATDGGNATIRSSNPTAATIALIFMSATPGADYTAPLSAKNPHPSAKTSHVHAKRDSTAAKSVSPRRDSAHAQGIMAPEFYALPEVFIRFDPH
jgi:hypothetical protein